MWYNEREETNKMLSVISHQIYHFTMNVLGYNRYEVMAIETCEKMNDVFKSTEAFISRSQYYISHLNNDKNSIEDIKMLLQDCNVHFEYLSKIKETLRGLHKTIPVSQNYTKLSLQQTGQKLGYIYHDLSFIKISLEGILRENGQKNPKTQLREELVQDGYNNRELSSSELLDEIGKLAMMQKSSKPSRIECIYCGTANPNSKDIIFCCGCGASLPKELLQ